MSRKRYYKSQNQGIQNLVHSLLVQTIIFTSIIVLLGAKSSSAAYIPAEPIAEPTLEAEQNQTANLDNIASELPHYFEPNAGQISDQGVKFFSRKNPSQTYFYDDFFKIFLTGPNSQAELKFSFKNSTPSNLVGQEETQTKTNYYIGNDKTNHSRDNPTYAKVTYQGIYPGISATYYSSNKELKYDLVVSPGADPNQIEIQVDGAKQLFLNQNNDIVISTTAGSLYDQNLYVYQSINGMHVEIPAKFKQLSANSYGFEILGEYDKSQYLIIDPLLYSTYLGGTGNDSAYAVYVNDDGIYLTGVTRSADFPSTIGPGALTGPIDAFLTQLSTDGSSILFSTYFGGSSNENSLANELIVDNDNDRIIIAGTTSSADLATTVGAFNEVYNGSTDGFIASFDLGGVLSYATYLGSAGNDSISDIYYDQSAEEIFVTGSTNNATFPVTDNSYDETHNGGYDAFVSSIIPDADGANDLTYSTFFGGSDNDYSVAISHGSEPIIVGYTQSTDLPTTAGAFQEDFPGGDQSGFLSEIDTYTTYFGGNGDNDTLSALDYDDDNNRYIIGGITDSDDLVLPDGYDSEYDFRDGFVTILDTEGSAEYSSYLGGSGTEGITDIYYDEINNVIYAVGTSTSGDWLLNGDYQTISGSTDTILVKLNPAITGARSLEYGTYLGGASVDYANSIFFNDEDDIFIVGDTSSADYPIASPYSAFIAGGNDVFIARIETLADTTFTVDTNNDTTDADAGDGICADAVGDCSLRAAIEEINELSPGRTIEFNIGGGGASTITLASPLPTPVGDLIIDGTSQPGYADEPLITIDGGGAVAESIDLDGGDNIEISGLIISNFISSGMLISSGDNLIIDSNYIIDNTQHGIKIFGFDPIEDIANLIISNNVISGNEYTGISAASSIGITGSITGNLIGTEPNGLIALPNNNGIGLSHNTEFVIGGVAESDRNIISGNTGTGIVTDSSQNNSVFGNYIGTTIGGDIALANGIGIRIVGHSNTVVGSEDGGNLISGNTGGGIFFDFHGSGEINYNTIGLNAAQDAALGNGSFGIELDNAAASTFSHNIISGNEEHGLLIGNDSADGHTITGNIFGFDAAGNTVPNGTYDLYIDASNSNQIGGEIDVDGNIFAGGPTGSVVLTGSSSNVFTGNYVGTFDGTVQSGSLGDYGLLISSASNSNEIGQAIEGFHNIFATGEVRFIGIETSDDNILVNNYIGTDSTSTFELPGSWGIYFDEDPNGTQIGGLNDFEQNVFANLDKGIVAEATGTGHAFYGNTFTNIATMGIDIGNNGPNTNDNLDADVGFNNLQNHPTNLRGTYNNGQIAITCSFNSAASTEYDIYFFANTTGIAEGTIYLGSITVTTNASGNASISAEFTQEMDAPFYLTALAVDPDDNTSEFSPVSAQIPLVPTGGTTTGSTSNNNNNNTDEDDDDDSEIPDETFTDDSDEKQDSQDDQDDQDDDSDNDNNSSNNNNDENDDDDNDSDTSDDTESDDSTLESETDTDNQDPETDLTEPTTRPSAPEFLDEIQYQRTENDLDNDKDGCSNNQEINSGSNPNIYDSLKAGISDCDVIEIYGDNLDLNADFLTVNGGTFPTYEFVVTGALHFAQGDSAGNEVSLKLVDQDNFTIDLGTTTIDENQLYFMVNDVELKEGVYLLIATATDQNSQTLRASDTITIDSRKRADVQLTNFSGIQFQNNRPVGSKKDQVLTVSKKAFAYGQAPQDSKVKAYWNSVLLTSVSLADSSTGTFYVEPREELSTDEIHTLVLVAENSENSDIKSAPLVIKFKNKESSSPIWMLFAILILIAAIAIQILRRPKSNTPVFENNVATSSYTGGMIIGLLLVVGFGFSSSALAYDKPYSYPQNQDLLSQHIQASLLSIPVNLKTNNQEPIINASPKFIPELEFENAPVLLSISFKELTYFYLYGGLLALFLLTSCLFIDKKINQKVVQSPTTPLRML